MKKTQKRVIAAALADLANGMTQIEVAEKYGTTKGTVSKWNRKYGNSTKKFPSSNEKFPCSTESFHVLANSDDSLVKKFPSSNEKFPCALDLLKDDIPQYILKPEEEIAKCKVKYADGHYYFLKQDGTKITYDSDYKEWKQLYDRACTANVILF